MFPASTKGGGQIASFPDVCKTPSPGGPVPIPYPNAGMLTQAKGSSCAKKVKICNKKVVTKKTVISRTMGDEPGVLKGVKSNSQMSKAKFRKGVAKVVVEGSPIINQLKSSAHNNTNANAPMGSQVSPSQTKVIVVG